MAKVMGLLREEINERVDKNCDVYPAGEEFTEKTKRDWHSLQDFLDETKDCESINLEKLNRIISEFSFPMLPGKE